MHTEAANGTDDENSSLASLGVAFLSPGYIGDVTIDEARQLQSELNSHIERAVFLVPYVTNMYREDRQRRMAECQLLWLQGEIERLTEQLTNTLNMIGFLAYSPAVLRS